MIVEQLIQRVRNIRLLFSIIFIIGVVNVWAVVDIVGVTYDIGTNFPLEYVNVVALRSDSSFVCGAMTDSDGRFSLKGEDIMLLNFRFIGYKEQSVTIEDSTSHPLLVRMTPTETMLGEVEVTARKPQTRIVGGAMETTVAGTSLSGMLSVYDMFQFVPMLSVQGDNVEVFGKGTPVYYINNRKVRDTNELGTLRPADILSVKVITNPGSRYGSEAGCVIVIRTRKAVGEGFSGFVQEDFGGLKRFHNALNAKLWYRQGGLELFGQLFHAYDNTQNIIAYQSEIYTSTPRSEDYTNCYGNNGNRYQGKVGFSYDFNGDHSIGGYYIVLGSKFRTRSHTETTLSTPLTADSWVENQSGNYTTFPYHSANLYYEGKIGKVYLSANFDYLGSEADDDSFHNEYGGEQPSRQFNTYSNTSSRLYAGNVAANYGYVNGDITLGEEVTSTRYQSAFDNPEGVVTTSRSKTDETAIALFASWQHRAGALNWNVGVRYEHRVTDYDDGTGSAHRDINDDIFPTMDLGGTHGVFSWNIGYAYRLFRPMFSQLSGNIIYMNRYTYQSGNPNLRPLRQQQAYVSAQYRDFWITGGFVHSDDKAVHISDIFGDDNDMILQHWVNFPPYNSYYLNAGYQTTIRRWTPSVSMGVNKQHFRVDFKGNSLLLDKPRWSFSLRNQLSLFWGLTLYANYSFASSGDIQTSRYEAMHDLSLGLSKTFLRGSLSVQLWAYDILDRQKLRYVKYDPAILKQGFTDRENRQIALRIRYQFNATRSRYKGQGAGVAEKQRL